MNKKGIKRTSQDVDKYLESFKIIEKLVQAEIIIVDLRDLTIWIDYNLHIQLMDVKNDSKYINFFKKIRGYLNYRRGLLQIKKVIEEPDLIRFFVFRNTPSIVNQDNDPLSFSIVSSPKNILVGTFQYNKVYYTELEEPKIAK